MVVTDGLHRVTGDLTPDSTGDYLPDGILNGKMSYARSDAAWFLWWHPIGLWLINADKGELAGLKWEHPFPEIEGEYLPNVGAAGDATVTEI